MTKSEINIICSKCGEKNYVEVEEILYRQLEENIKKKYQFQFATVKEEYQQKEKKLTTRSIELEQRRKAISKQIDSQVREKLASHKKELYNKIRLDLKQENEEKFKILQSELTEKSRKLKELNQAKSEIEKLKREKSELRSEIELENQKKITQILQDEREKMAKRESEKNELRIFEKEKIIKQLQDQLSEAQRKAEQSSIQLQGEVQELGIEEWLRKNFPLDKIEEVKKGQRGADLLQIIKTETNPNCGLIYYESKRTKNFQPDWIEKFKDDMRDKNANIGVLVTEAMPKGMDRVGLIKGIWICSYQEFKGLCFVFRENIITISNAISTQENKGEKMRMLYDFLTSNEFKLHIEGIFDQFIQMQTDLNTEKRLIQGTWKKREKQIEKVLLNTNYMYSSIKGIGGSAIQPIKQLELSEHKNDEFFE